MNTKTPTSPTLVAMTAFLTTLFEMTCVGECHTYSELKGILSLSSMLTDDCKWDANQGSGITDGELAGYVIPLMERELIRFDLGRGFVVEQPALTCVGTF